MTIKISCFSFDIEIVKHGIEDPFVAEIPSGLCDREQLFEALGQRLHLPKYFGRNWDALSDCLKDLSWIKQHAVIITHNDMPVQSKTDINNYLAVLSESVDSWKVGEDHKLIIAFPLTAYKTIVAISASGT